jgi:hypothetical protein
MAIARNTPPWALEAQERALPVAAQWWNSSMLGALAAGPSAQKGNRNDNLVTK